MKRLTLLLALALTAAAIWLWQSDRLAQDSCLDSGGRWSQAQATCEH
jgi:hypothetical protein